MQRTYQMSGLSPAHLTLFGTRSGPQLGKSSRGHWPASRGSSVPRIASPGKDQNSKLEVWFLLNAFCFCTIGKSKIVIQGPLCIHTSVLYTVLTW